MTSPSLSDLRYAFYGGGSAAEYAFLKSAQAAGITGATLLDFNQNPGAALARATNTVQTNVGLAELDIDALSISFYVPANRDVTVQAIIPGVGSGTASDIVTCKLTNEANAMVDPYALQSTRPGTANRGHVTLVITEVIPAGTTPGVQVTRKVRGINSASALGFTNLAGGSRCILEAFVR